VEGERGGKGKERFPASKWREETVVGGGDRVGKSFVEGSGCFRSNPSPFLGPGGKMKGPGKGEDHLLYA